MASLGDVIARLAVNLTMETAGLEEGADVVEKRIALSAKRFDQFGQKMTAIGGKLSLAFTAPLAALGVKVLGMADKVNDLRNAANIAGESFEQFQRGAHAAASVGVEFEKFGDILKDTQDKLGDFAANGGGEMKDFFDNIGPKVGVTIDQFKRLSGSEALQLYYNSLVKAGVSQKEMVFYMESIADEGSALIPILAENGAKMKELGAQAAVVSEEDAQGMKAYTDAMARLGQSVDKVLIALARSGIIEVATALVDKVAAAADAFAALPPGVQEFAVGLGAIVAVAGPVIVALGTLISSASTVIGALSTIGGLMASTGTAGGAATVGIAALGGALSALGPLVAVVAGVAAAGYAIYKNWDKIAPVLEDLWATVTQTLGPPLREMVAAVSEAFTALWNGPLGPLVKAADALFQSFGGTVAQVLGIAIVEAVKLAARVIGGLFQSIADGVRAVTALFQGDWSKAWQLAAGIVDRAWGGLPGKVIGWMQSMVNGIKTQVVDRLNAVWDGVTKRVEAVGNAFFRLYDAVVGHSYVPDMVDGIAAQMKRLDSEFVSPATLAAQVVGDRFEALRDRISALTAELFPEIAQREKYRTDMDTIDEAEARGTYTPEQATEARNRVLQRSGALDGVNDLILNKYPELGKVANDNAGGIETANVRIAESFKDMAQASISAVQNFASAIKGGGFLDIVSGVLNLGLQLGGAGVFGSKVAGVINKASIPGFARGTSSAPAGVALVGERGPELVKFRGGERVYNNADTRQMIGGRDRTSNVFDLRGALVTEDLLEQMDSIASGRADMAVVRERRTGVRKSQRKLGNR